MRLPECFVPRDAARACDGGSSFSCERLDRVLLSEWREHRLLPEERERLDRVLPSEWRVCWLALTECLEYSSSLSKEREMMQNSTDC